MNQVVHGRNVTLRDGYVPPLNNHRGNARSLENCTACHQLVVILKPPAVHKEMTLDPRKRQRKGVVFGCSFDILRIHEEARCRHLVHTPRPGTPHLLLLVLSSQASVVFQQERRGQETDMYTHTHTHT